MEITICPGHGKNGNPEIFEPIRIHPGEMLSVVGCTGSGKTRLIRDIEQLADGDSVTARRILLDGKAVPAAERTERSRGLVAHLGQNMRFVLDTTVEDFIKLHAACRKKAVSAEEVLAAANAIAQEEITLESALARLSGGQARALMTADIACICDSPVVLIDEIENAGVDKTKAFDLLCGSSKVIIAVTHDPHTALMANRRIVLEGGAVIRIAERTAGEEALYRELTCEYERGQRLRTLLRKGSLLA